MREDPMREAEFEHGIRLFNHGEYFEAHEAIEQVWVNAAGARRFFLQAIIHFAVAFHHDRQSNPAGAERQLRKALKKLAAYLPACEGIDTAALYEHGVSIWERIRRGEPAGPLPVISSSERTPSRA